MWINIDRFKNPSDFYLGYITFSVLGGLDAKEETNLFLGTDAVK